MLAICAVLLVAWSVTEHPIAGAPRIIGPAHDDNFPTVNEVSGTPAEWVSAVCKPAVRRRDDPFALKRCDTRVISLRGAEDVPLYPSIGFELPGATFSAVCAASEDTSSDMSDLLVARFPSEDPMQRDLARNGINWYSFTANHGNLFVIATRAEEAVASPTGWWLSPLLDPLTRYGFIVYRNPGD